MDDDDQVKTVYAHFGLAVYLAQVLEHGIVNAMVITRMPQRDHISRNDIDNLMSREFDLTLGGLIRDLEASTPVPNTLHQSLAHALQKRNWLAHDYFREHAAAFMTLDGRQRMIAELQSVQRLFQETDRLLAELLRPVREAYGVSDEAIETEINSVLGGLEHEA